MHRFFTRHQPRTVEEPDLFEQFAQAELQDMSHRMCSERIVEMRDALIARGLQIGHAKLANDKTLLSFDERGFEYEVSVLKDYAGALSYSDELYDWFDAGRERTVNALHHALPVSKLLRHWRLANNRLDRVQMITDVLEIHAQNYSDRHIRLDGPYVDVMTRKADIEKGIIGCVMMDYEDIINGALPSVQIAPSLLHGDEESFTKAMVTSHHELVHWFLMQMVALMQARKLSGNHEIYQDVEMQNEKMKAGAIIDSAIYSAYSAQREEELCIDQEDAFETEYLSVQP